MPIQVRALKDEHPIYGILRESSQSIDMNATIIGLDDLPKGMAHPYYQDETLYSKPFLIYLEEYNTFQYPRILHHKNFKGFVSHITDTCERVYNDFGVPSHHIPLSSFPSSPDVSSVRQHIESLDNERPVNLIAWGSWTDIHDNNFGERGGPAVDQLMMFLLSKNFDVTLSMRIKSNLECEQMYPDRVELFREYAEQDEKDKIFSRGDIFLLPSRQVHSMSLMNAMSFGMTCIVSRGWGISEFCNKLNSDCIDELDSIVELFQNKEKLKLKRRNSLSFYMTNHSRENYVNSLRNILASCI